MPLRQKDLDELKKPFGTLIPDGQVTKQKLAGILKGAGKVVSVGDRTTERLVGFGIIPDVAVVDGRERRSKRSYPAKGMYGAKELYCTNPAGTISEDALSVLREALAAKQKVRVLVEGEEDLLALPAFWMAAAGSVVLYGQPLEGMVAVRITPAKQKEAKDLMDRIIND